MAADGWYVSPVHSTGPIENSGAFVLLTLSGTKQWIYVPPEIALAVNQTCIAAIEGPFNVYVWVVSNTIRRCHLLA